MLDPLERVSALVVGSFRLPTKGHEFATALLPLSTRLLADALAAAGERLRESTGGTDEDSDLEGYGGGDVSLGNFGPEAFPNGIGGGLDFVATRFPGTGKAKLALSWSPLTELVVMDGNQRAYAFRGAQSLAGAVPKFFDLPIEVRVRTQPTGDSVQASIRRLEGP